jgi:cathepsin B
MSRKALQSGPISVVMSVYEDFFQYSSGVYTPNKASGLAGYMQARLIGYGATTGPAPLNYWIAATVRQPLPASLAASRRRLNRSSAALQTWGTGWGEAGYFRIIRGQDACGIENGVLGYCPVQLVAAV